MEHRPVPLLRHADMYGALLTEPERADSDAGVLFMHNEGFSTMCGHGVIAVATIVLERGLMHRRGTGLADTAGVRVTLDAPAGQVRATAHLIDRGGARRVRRVSFINVPSFVLAPGVPVTLAGIYGTIFTAPPTMEGADLRNVTIFADREVDRSPCGTGTCAVLAVLDAMELVAPSRPFVHESIIGTTFMVDPDDPLARGFRI